MCIRFTALCLFSLMMEATSLASAASVVMKDNFLDKDGLVATKPQFEFTAGALFLQPTGSNLDYAVLGFPLPVNSPHWDVATVFPGYSTGFYLGGRYILRNAVNDLQLNWAHLSTNDADAVHAGANQFTTPIFQSGPSVGQTINPASQNAYANVKFNYDIINLDAGQMVGYGYNTQLRFFAGLSGGQLKETFTTSFQDNAKTFNISYTNKSQFTGVGPLFGVDTLYKLPYSIGVTGTLSASALIGSLNPSTTYAYTSPQVSGINYQSIAPRNTTQLVPGLHGKLGLNHAHLFDNGSIWTIEAGYEYANYFNAIVAYNPLTVFGDVTTGTIALSSLGKTVSNFAVNGPFVNLSVQFA